VEAKSDEERRRPFGMSEPGGAASVIALMSEGAAPLFI